MDKGAKSKEKGKKKSFYKIPLSILIASSRKRGVFSVVKKRKKKTPI